jgi:bis(5'-nucleosyl)-tetraphosphatase (symmetrical)
VQPGGQRAAEGGFADDAVEHADGGDAHLHGGQELRRLLHQLQCRAGAGVAAFLHGRQPRLAAGGHRQFRHGEDAVEQGEKDDQQQIHARPAVRRGENREHGTLPDRRRAGLRRGPGRLLDELAFSPSRDRLVLLGDLVNRGPRSLAVLRRVQALGDAATCLLGNHDLHLLAVSLGVRPPHRSDTLDDILAAPDRDALLDGLRQRPLAWRERGVLMVHAGVLPQWTATQTMALAAEVESALRGPDLAGFARAMYGNQPDRWHDSLQGAERLRVIVNALTRMRFCSADGVMEFESTGSLDGAPEGYMPWFEVPGRKTEGQRIAFGHWSTLGAETAKAGGGLLNGTLPLDTGCVWGGCLSAVRLGADGHQRELIQVRCPQAQKPGGRA